MSVIVFLLLLLSFTSVLSATDNTDENALLRFKQQLGDPEFLGSWVPGFKFCDTSLPPPTYITITCNRTGHVDGLFMEVDHRFTAPFPDAVCSLAKLKWLFVYGMLGLYGQLPPCLTQLSNLRGLSITNTSLSGPVPSFHNNENLITIKLSHSYLSGTIPASLSTLPNLKELDLSYNFLTGTVPSGLVHGTLTTSAYLRLNNNNLTGELPECYGWADILMIDVSNNRLTGDASFLFLSNSTVITLAKNEFEFDLSFVQLSFYLVDLDISHNRIFGSMPYSLANSFRLYYVNLSFNKLCGELPQGEYMFRYEAAAFANNECLCGSPLPPCCFDSAPAPVPEPVSTPPF